MAAVRIYDSFSRAAREFKKSRARLKVFVCGPTVYGPAHIGHARIEVFFDIFARYLRSEGYNLLYVQNITDVDDKIIERAAQEKIKPQTIARRYEKEYLRDMKDAGVTAVDRRARASDHIPDIIRQIKRLIGKGLAYETSSGVYFEVRRFPRYGQLSGQDLQALRPGWRIEPDFEKRDPLDFALWKRSSAAEIGWESPWGRGRPGWHIEDTAITEKLLGQQYDIHGGGIDLKFPHHESEIAQQEGASGKAPFVKAWMHVGMVTVDGEKMAKSAGNFTTLRSFLERHGANTFRFLVASAHYRSPIAYTERAVEQARAALATLREALATLAFVGRAASTSPHELKAVAKRIKKYDDAFRAAMNDDVNTPQAFAVLFTAINETSARIWRIDRAEALALHAFIAHKLALFGIMFKRKPMPAAVKLLCTKRLAARAQKDFSASDALRAEIGAFGYSVLDTPLGQLLLDRQGV